MKKYKFQYRSPKNSHACVPLTSRQTWQNINSKRRLQRVQNVQEEKRHQKKETTSCFCICSFCFWGEVFNSWILNDIGRNFLLGNRKKIAKSLMRTFTCRSTFLYVLNWRKTGDKKVKIFVTGKRQNVVDIF